jgi:type I restriction enzyme, S subunit
MNITKGYKNTEVGVIPEDWDVTILNDLAIKIGSGITPTGGSTVYTTSGRPFVRSQNIGWGHLLLDDIAFINDEIHETFLNTEIKLNDVFLNISGASIGRSSFASEVLVGGNVNQHVCIIRLIDKKLNPIFLNLFLLSKNGQKQIDNFQSGGNRQGLNIGQIKTFKIPVPPLAEQQRIAAALSAADDLINSLEALIAKKRNIKQGTMQTLLQPKEGWEVCKIQDISKVGRGRVISHKEINSAIHNAYPVYSSQTTNNGIMGYIDSFDFNGEYITWTTDGEKAGTVFYRNGKFNCTNVCGTIKLTKGNALYLSIYLGTVTSKYVSRNLANPKLMNDVMKNIEILLPPLAEQTRIATILSDMDAEILGLETKLDKYRQIKLGMMQNLLTGKIRLL